MLFFNFAVSIEDVRSDENHGVIQSPNYPAVYPNEQDEVLSGQCI